MIHPAAARPCYCSIYCLIQLALSHIWELTHSITYVGADSLNLHLLMIAMSLAACLLHSALHPYLALIQPVICKITLLGLHISTT